MRIKHYENDPVVSLPDKLLGSDSTGKTYNYPFSLIAAFFAAGTYDDSWIQPALDDKTETSVFDLHTGASNPHGTTKADIGIGNVDNTSDTNKPVSAATQTALNQKVNLFNSALTKTTNYSTANNNLEQGLLLVLDYVSAPYTVTLDDTGLTVGFEQQIFNDSGQDITINSSDTIKGVNVPLESGYFAYYKLIATDTWILAVG